MRQSFWEIFFLLVFLALSCNDGSFGGSSGESDPGIAPEDFRLEPKELSVSEGKEALFKAFNNKTGKDVSSSVTWSIDNESIAEAKKGGTFLTKKAGTTKIKASKGKLSGTATLYVELPQVKYSRLVFGIENCPSDNTPVGLCLGDCNDSWLVIQGDLSIDTYNNDLYITSNVDQTINVTTYTGSWNYDENEINPDSSRLNIVVNNASDENVDSVSLKMKNRGEGSLNGGDFANQVQTADIYVKGGYLIYIQTHFEGTQVGADKTCKLVDSKFTRKMDTKAGFLLMEPGCDKMYCSEKQ